MARLFDDTTTSPEDEVDFGSPSKLDDLIQDGQSLEMVIGRVDVDATMAISSKMNASASTGYVWLLGTVTGGTGNLFMRLYCPMSGAAKDIYAGTADDVVVDQHEAWCWTLDSENETDGQDGVRLYRGPLETPITEVAGYVVGNAGSGTFNADASDPQQIGNWQVNNEPFGGDLAWGCRLHKSGGTAFTAAEVTNVQAALLLCQAGRVAKGKAWLEDIGTLVLLWELESDGTVTDHSDTPATGTLTGTASGTNQGTWIAPSTKHYDSEPDATVDITDQIGYDYASPMATAIIDTDAATGEVWFNRTLDLTGTDYDRMAGIGVVIDGVWEEQLASTTGGVQAVAFSGYGTGAKKIEFVDGARSRPGGVPAEVSTVILIRLDDTGATQDTPADGSRHLTVYSESIWSVGFFANPAQRDGVGARIRLGQPARIDGVTFCGYGGAELTEDGYTAGGRTDLVAKMTGPSPIASILAIGVNDWAQNAELTTWAAAFEDLIDAWVAATTDEHLFVIGPIDKNDWGNDNGAGAPYTLAEMSTAMSDAVDNVGLARVTFHDPGPDGDAVLTYPTNYFDVTHPDSTGHGLLYDWLAAILNAALPYVLEVDPLAVVVGMTDIGFRYDRLLGVDSLAVVVAPTDVGVRHDRALVVDPLAVVVSPTDVDLTYTAGFALIVDTLAITVALTDVFFGRTVLANSLAVTVALTDIGLRRNAILAVDPLAVAVAPTDIGVRYDRFIEVDPLALTIAPTDIGVRYDRALTADPLAVVVSLTDITLTATGSYLLVVDPLAVAVAATDVGLRHDHALGVDPLAVAVALTDVGFSYDHVLAVESLAIAVALSDILLTVTAVSVTVVVTGKFPEEHASALADILANGGTVTVSRESTTFDDDDRPTVTQSSVGGAGLAIPGDLERYEALRLVEHAATTLLFAPTSYVHINDGPKPGDRFSWPPSSGETHTVRSVEAVAPDGFGIVYTVIGER